MGKYSTTTTEEDIEVKICDNCGFETMVALKSCMLRCSNCGTVKDCSEKMIW